MKKAGTVIKKMRHENGISQENLARVLHVDRSVISKWETGSSEPNLKQLEEIAAYFQVPVNSFFEEDVSERKRLFSPEGKINISLTIIVLCIISLFCIPLSLPIIIYLIYLSFKKKTPVVVRIFTIFTLMVLVKDVLFAFGIDILPSFKFVINN